MSAPESGGQVLRVDRGRVFNTVMQKGHFGPKKVCVYRGMGFHEDVFISINYFWIMN